MENNSLPVYFQKLPTILWKKLPGKDSQAKFKKFEKKVDMSQLKEKTLKYDVNCETANDYFDLLISKEKGYRAKIDENYGKADTKTNDNGFYCKKVNKAYSHNRLLEIFDNRRS
jgi:hypothetical protein